eukprot:10503-Heterococcus_DN1.PRE.2
MGAFSHCLHAACCLQLAQQCCAVLRSVHKTSCRDEHSGAMSYFITGSQSGAVPSLKILALDVCAKHINYLSDLANMPLLEYQELLARANTRATPEIVARLERNNPGFVCAETDESFWKLAVGKH